MMAANGYRIRKGDTVSVVNVGKGVVEYAGLRRIDVLMDDGELVLVDIHRQRVDVVKSTGSDERDASEKEDREIIVGQLLARSESALDRRIAAKCDKHDAGEIDDNEANELWRRMSVDRFHVEKMLSELPYDLVRLIHDAL
jgi:hypothetical protein